MIGQNMAVLLEVLTIFVVAINCGKWSRSFWRNCIGVGIIIFQILVIYFQKFNISVWEQVLICSMWIYCFVGERQWWKSLEIGIYAYGGVLLYLEAFYVLWVPSEWFAVLGYYGVSIGVNSLMLGTVMAIIGLLKSLEKKYGVITIAGWLRWVRFVGCAAMMIVCQEYRAEVMTLYRLEAKAVTLLIMLALVFLLIVFIWNAKSKIQEKEQQLEMFAKAQHDYLKRLKYAENSHNQEFVQDARQDEYELNLFLQMEESLAKVLRMYKEEAAKKKVGLIIEASGHIPQWGLSEKSWMTIMGNLLENALHAVEQLPEEKRWIRIQFSDVGKQIVIVNPCEKVEEIKDRKGYGQELAMKEVQRTGGTMEKGVMEEMYVVVLRWQ